MEDKEVRLRAINEHWKELCTCALKDESTQAVPGEGNADAHIVFIGEAPGKREDMEGRPFIGAAGKFLDEMLEDIGMKRSDIYITNIVKYRPPNNRDPLPDEVLACAPWLAEQIASIDPKIIVLLGQHALHHFFPEAKIADVHGAILKRSINSIGAQNFFALYHPAAALYNGSMRDVLKNDFRKLPKVLEQVVEHK